MNTNPNKVFRLEHGFQIRDTVLADRLGADGVLVGATRPDPTNAMWLGRLAEFQRMEANVFIDLDGAHAIYVMGKRRSGKTFTLGTILEGLLGIDGYSRGAKGQMVVVLDTMNVFLTAHTPAYDFDRKHLDRWGLGAVDTSSIDIYYPAGSTPPPQSVRARPFTIPPHEFSVEDWCELFEIDPFVSPMGQLIGEVLVTIRETGYTVDGIETRPQDAFGIPDVVRCVEDSSNFANFEESTRRALGRRFRTLQNTGMFAAGSMEIGAPDRASIFLLRDIDPELRKLFVAFVTASILRARADTESLERILPTIAETDPDRRSIELRVEAGTPRAWMIIDEAHNYVPASGGGRCRKLLNRYVTEGRNLGLSIVVATQHPSALDPALKRNADIVVVHTLSMADDISVAQGMLTTTVPGQLSLDTENLTTRAGSPFEEATRKMPRGYCFVSNDGLSRIVPVAVRPRVTYHGGSAY